MKVLSLWNPPSMPWASLCVLGAKKFETRSHHWHFAYRGPLLIAATASCPLSPEDFPCPSPAVAAVFASLADHPAALARGTIAPQGAILGVVELVDVVDIDLYFELPTEPERSFGSYAPGRRVLVLERPRALRCPIPARGHQGLWDFDIVGHAELEALVR